MKNITILLAVVFGGYFGYQKYFSNSLYGTWTLDANAMAKQLEGTEIPRESIDNFRQQLGNGRTTTTITKDKIEFTINGKSVEFPYEVLSAHEKCTTLKIELKTLDYCIEGSSLEVHNRNNKMFEVYKR